MAKIDLSPITAATGPICESIQDEIKHWLGVLKQLRPGSLCEIEVFEFRGVKCNDRLTAIKCITEHIKCLQEICRAENAAKAVCVTVRPKKKKRCRKRRFGWF